MATKTAKGSTSNMADDTYFLWVCLRTMVIKTGSMPTWEFVSKALGGTTKAHSYYCRYNALLKNGKLAKDGLPDLEKLLADAQESGELASSGIRKSRAATGACKGQAPKLAAENAMDEAAIGDKKKNGSKRKADNGSDDKEQVVKKSKTEEEFSD